VLKNFIKIFCTFILAFLINHASAQTYINGQSVESFSNIATSTLLPKSTRINHSSAFTKLKSLYPKTTYTSASKLNGEFWIIDGMLINIIARRIGPKVKLDNLNELEYMYAPKNSQLAGTSVDMTRFNDYFSEIKVVKNSNVLIYYYKTLYPKKTFVVQDKMGKYVIDGAIYANKTDYIKAQNYIDTLINSITFK